MPAAKAPAADRYFQPEVTKVLILTTVANMTTGPTRSEINAGSDISDDVAAISGFMVTTNQIQTPDLGKRFVSSIPGRINADDSSVTLYAGKDGEDARTVLARDDEVYVVFLDGGDVEDGPMDVFHCTVGSVGKQRDIEDAPKLVVNFVIRGWTEDLEVPAAA